MSLCGTLLFFFTYIVLGVSIEKKWKIIKSFLREHPEVSCGAPCPTCRIPLRGPRDLMRNIPMEKLALSYFGTRQSAAGSASSGASRRGSLTNTPSRRGRPAAAAGAAGSLMGAAALSRSSENAFLEWSWVLYWSALSRCFRWAQSSDFCDFNWAFTVYTRKSTVLNRYVTGKTAFIL